MLYQFVRPFATIGLKVFFKKIYFSKREKIPLDKPIIFAANHPTAFLEPCILACFQPHTLHFLVRGDFFKKTFHRKLMEDLNMIPVYRLKDGGFQNLKQNYQTFEKCYAALEARKAIMILAEGTTKHEKRLRPIKKGIGRIVVGALENNPDLDIQIVPVGVNYTAADQFRSDVMIEFGEPIAVQDYKNTAQQNSNQAVKEITEEIRKRLEKKVIIIEREEDEELTEQLFLLHRNERKTPRFPLLSLENEPLQQEKRIADKVNEMGVEEKQEWKEKINTYFAQIKNHKIADDTLLHLATMQNHWGTLGRFYGLLLGLPFFLLGFLFNILPLGIAKYVADSRIKYVEFYSPVLAAVGTFGWLIYYILLWIIAFCLGLGKLAYLFLLLLPFLGYFAIIYQEFYQQSKAIWQASNLSREKQEKLLTTRKAIMDNFRY